MSFRTIELYTDEIGPVTRALETQGLRTDSGDRIYDHGDEEFVFHGDSPDGYLCVSFYEDGAVARSIEGAIARAELARERTLR